MQRCLTTAVAVLFSILAGSVAVSPCDVGAQVSPKQSEAGWNSERVLALVERATARRAAALADTGLRSYKAEARGYLTFLAQMGDGFQEPPKIVRTDQIASDLYWRAPNFSKQFIKGRRDTLLLPTDINYHRDHLGIVQNNFPDIIRLGDGDEVEDVPHPLSNHGIGEYDFAIRDSLQIRLGAKTLDVYEVRVRPKNDRAPRTIGSVYIDRESAEVVRMTLSFTRVALKDKALEDVTVVLENGLIEGRFWLPRQQTIEIRRTGKWLDYPVRGIIRGRWEISDYQVNANVPQSMMFGHEIMAAPGSKVTRDGRITHPDFTFEGKILDSLPPDVTAASDEEIQKVQDEVRTMVRNQALARSRDLALSGRRISDFVHVNRVEGLALGAGVLQRVGAGVSLFGGASYGFSDRVWKARGSIEHTRANGARVTLSGYRGLRDVSLVQERSGVFNTLAAQEFGSDYTNLYFARGASLTVSTSTLRAIRGSLEFAHERHDSVGVHATPASGRYSETLGFPPFRETRLTLGLDVPTRRIGNEFDVSLSVRVSGIRGRPAIGGGDAEQWIRPVFLAQVERDLGSQQVVLQSVAAAIIGPTLPPVQHAVFLGGPISAPGYDFHSLVSRAGASQRVEWRFKVPFVSIPLGGWGRAPATLTLAPYANAAWLDGEQWKPSLGLGVLSIFDLLRIDVAKGLRGGRWMFGVDVSRAFWGVL